MMNTLKRNWVFLVDLNIIGNEFEIDIFSPPGRIRSSDRDDSAGIMIPDLVLQLK
jgi:hypothetical protein